MAVSEAQKRARDKWNAKNKEKMQRIKYKAVAKLYILSSNKEELEIVKEWFKIREEQLNS